MFPLNLPEQKIYKDAPFDVTESRLTNSFFDAWTEIKNNVILDWVDGYDATQRLGVALFTDHSTSYAHALDYPLGLTAKKHPARANASKHYAEVLRPCVKRFLHYPTGLSGC